MVSRKHLCELAAVVLQLEVPAAKPLEVGVVVLGVEVVVLMLEFSMAVAVAVVQLVILGVAVVQLVISEVVVFVEVVVVEKMR
jgi:hypothetical protein